MFLAFHLSFILISNLKDPNRLTFEINIHTLVSQLSHQRPQIFTLKLVHPDFRSFWVSVSAFICRFSVRFRIQFAIRVLQSDPEGSERLYHPAKW